MWKERNRVCVLEKFRLKQIALFFFVSGLAGLAAVFGSILGGAASHVGLFIGAVSGGLIGVVTALVLSNCFRLIRPQDVGPGILGGCIGFVAAAALAAGNAHTAIIPIVSTGLVGLGAMAALAISGRGPKD